MGINREEKKNAKIIYIFSWRSLALCTLTGSRFGGLKEEIEGDRYNLKKNLHILIPEKRDARLP